MFNGKMKAVTFSFDDGVTQDKKLIAILNKYGLKCTFNLNSGFLGREGSLIREGKTVSHNKIPESEIKKTYAGHEIACHTLTHPDLRKLSDEDIVRQVEDDRRALSQLAGYVVTGMAYPCGTFDSRVAGIIRDKTGILYSRTIKSTFDFEPQKDLICFNPTVYYHGDYPRAFDLARQFIELEADSPKIFYIWGHAYEFDIETNNDTWDNFDKFCSYIAGRDDIFYGTNKEILLD